MPLPSPSRSTLLLLGACAWAVAGCGDPARRGPAEDSGFPMDTWPADAGTPPVDAGGDTGTPPADTGPRDTDPADTGPADTGPADTGPADTGPTGACAAALAAAEFDFEAGADGFTHGAIDDADVSGPSWPYDSWERGTPTHGPSACAEGSACWGMDLDDNYVQCARAALVSPAIDLTACAGQDVVVVFDHWYSFWQESGYSDGGVVELASGSGSFAPAELTTPGTVWISESMGLGYSCWASSSFHVDGLPGFVGSSGSWVTAEAPVTSYLASPFRLRFAYGTGVAYTTTDPSTSRYYTAPGWYVDHVRFELR